MKTLSFEQETSLVDYLTDAGVEHGDTALVELTGVGVRNNDSESCAIAFCPVQARVLKVLKRGSPAERNTPIPPVVCVSKNLRERLFKDAPLHGFVTLRLQIHTNGVIQLGGRVTCKHDVRQTAHVHGSNSYQEFLASRPG
jgi:hypothetical protein